MRLEDAMLAIVILVFMVVLIGISFIGYFKNWRSVPEEAVVIPPAPVDVS